MCQFLIGNVRLYFESSLTEKYTVEDCVNSSQVMSDFLKSLASEISDAEKCQFLIGNVRPMENRVFLGNAFSLQMLDLQKRVNSSQVMSDSRIYQLLLSSYFIFSLKSINFQPKSPSTPVFSYPDFPYKFNTF